MPDNESTIQDNTENGTENTGESSESSFRDDFTKLPRTEIDTEASIYQYKQNEDFTVNASFNPNEFCMRRFEMEPCIEENLKYSNEE